MKNTIQKYLLIPVSLALMSIVSSSLYAADACSPYLGQASINELYKDNTTQVNDPDDLVEVKVLDPSITSAIYSDWTIRICEFDGNGNKNDGDGCSLEISLSSFDSSTLPWLVLSDGTIGSYYNFATGFDAILLDGSGLVIDYLSVDGYNLQEVPGCNLADLAFDGELSTPGASDKFIFRDPDGTGDWSSTSSAADLPTEGSTNNGTGGSTSLDHFSITPATINASTCLANAITIIAENPGNNPVNNYTGQIQITVSTNHGNWSINNADGILSPDPDTNDDGAVSYTFVDTDLSEIVLNFSNTHAEDIIITVSDTASGVTTSSVLINFSRNVFIITEDLIQIAGRPQSMVVEMWADDAAASPSCAIDTNYNSTAQILQASIDRFTVLTGADDPTINTVVIPDTPASAAITLDFSATPGSAAFNLNTTDVGQYALTLEDTTLVHSESVISGSSSLLTVRPFGLAVTNIIAGITNNPEGAAFDSPVFTTAGSNFSSTVAGVLWSAADDTEVGNGDGVLDTGSYDDNAIARSYAWDTTLSVLTTGGFTPTTGIVGTLSSSAPVFVGGSATVNDLQYTEVGSFTLQSLATGFLGVLGADIVGHDIIVGRFTPAYFAIAPTNGEFANACTTGATLFTYIGEPFTYGPIHPSFQVSAMNALDSVTLNYTGADWAKLSDDSVDLTIPTADGTKNGSDSTTPMVITYTQDGSFYTISETSGGIFNFEFANDGFVYDRDANSEISEFDSDIDLTVTAVIDQEGISTTAAFTLTPDPAHLRFGRIKMSNVHGSELIDLAMPMFVEYFNAGAYTINGDDTCTTVVTANLDITDNLSTTGASIISVTNDPILLGDLGVTLTAPGAGIDGSIIVTPNLTVVADWLRYEWDTTVGVDPFDDNPWGIATFGIYSGNEVNIYQIQTFQ